MSALLFNFEGNYKRVIEEYTSLLEGSVHWDSRAFRIYVVEQMTDAYIEQTGLRPDGKILERLADLLLHEELSDSRPDKMTIEEYPIMSERQYAKRTTGLTRRRNKAGVVTYEVPLEYGQNIATDGVDYTPHTRTFYSPRP